MVTVCLNARDSIRLTLDSVRRQSFAGMEHVVIDGGSTDGTCDIVREYAPAEIDQALRAHGFRIETFTTHDCWGGGCSVPRRRQLEDDQRALVGTIGVPTYELPRLAGGIDIGGLYELAAELKDQGLA